MPAEYRAVWSVPGGGTGYSVFHHSIVGLDSSDQLWVDAVREFFADQAAQIPNDVTISFEAEIAELNTQTGVLEDVRAITAPASVAGSGAGDWMGGAGYRIDWTTGLVVAGKRLRGRTFIVPAVSTGFDPDGTPGATMVSTATTAANDYIAAVNGGGGSPVVWSRTHGVDADIVAGVVPDKSALLRSRRD